MTGIMEDSLIINDYDSYRRFVGKRSNKNLYNQQGVLCLPAYSTLTCEIIKQLLDQRISLSDSDILSDDDNVGRAVEDAVVEIKEIFNEAKRSNEVMIRNIERNVVPAINELIQSYDIVSILKGLENKDDFTLRHSIAVGVLSTMIGRWLGLDQQQLKVLSTAAVVHDIGKVKIPTEILNKKGKLTPNEYELIKKHTVYGYELLMNSKWASERHALVALQHHERMDGSGYPYKIRNGEIDFLSRIVAVADVFHAMSSKRVYKEALPFYQVMQYMYDLAFGQFDPIVIAKFTHKLMNALIGNEVLLSNGLTGKIVKVNSYRLTKPLILVNRRFIDLSKETQLNIERI